MIKTILAACNMHLVPLMTDASTCPVTTAQYSAKFGLAKITPAKLTAAQEIARQILKSQERYLAVSKATGVPWSYIGVIHVRESDRDFNTYLGQGDPLFNRATGKAIPSTHVPHEGPYEPQTWENGAVHALGTSHLGQPQPLGYWLGYLEQYNGLGYRHRGVADPYLWSWTDQYISGKYIADFMYSTTAVDHQPGCVAILKCLGIN